MLSSGLTKKFLSELGHSFHNYSKPYELLEDTSWVYADDHGMRVLTGFINGKIHESGCFATTIDAQGWMQLLSTQD